MKYNISHIVLLVFLTLLCASPIFCDPILPPCSFPISRHTRTIISEIILPTIESADYILPTTCPLNPSLDMYNVLESVRFRTAMDKWQCRFCSKVFEDEVYLDNHMYRMHKDQIPQGAEICLADYCDILSCNSMRHDESGNTPAPRKCTPSAMEKLRFTCQGVMHKCFPPQSGSVAHRLHEMFNAEFCNKLTCGNPQGGAFKTGDNSVTSTVLYYILSIVVVVFVVVFYFVACMNRSPSSRDALSAKRHAGYLQSFSKRKKEKGF